MGEVNKFDEFGQTIVRLVHEHTLNRVLEIGSWDGTGSTQCFIESMRYLPSPELYCVELRKDRFEDLLNNTKTYSWVKCFNTSTVSAKTFTFTSFDDIWNSPYNKIDSSDRALIKSWYDDDLTLIRECTEGYLDTDTKFYDAVLIDGGEFSGYSEFKLVKDRTNFLFLDDYYRAFKTRQAAIELLEDPEWEVIAGNKNYRNGYAVFKRKVLINDR